MRRKGSFGQRFNMRFMRSKGSNSRASEVQEELLRQDDLVRDAVNRHRALTADQSEDISTGVDNVALEGHYLPRQTDVDRWKSYNNEHWTLESPGSDLSLSLSSHEDNVSIESSLSDITMESGKRFVRAVVGKVRSVIPDSICLQKSKRGGSGFFRKNKIWLKTKVK